jgi:hypothetical protein
VLQRTLIARIGTAGIGVLGLALLHCGAVGGDDPVRASSQAILGGSLADAPDSPVLLLQGPEGACSAVLVAPNLVVTARHCVANTTPGPFSCAASGEVVNTGNGAGQIGTDNPPGALGFFGAARVNAGSFMSASPDAVGMQIISTQSPTACRDDLAFVVLDRTIPGLVPAPIRINRQTSVGEAVSVSGYGLTDRLEPTELRTVDGIQIAGIGPDVAPDSTQVAPVRAVRVGPVTCQGDSGGPILSTATGAVIAIVSLGSQAGTNGPYCTPNQLADTTGPRLAAYGDWILTVFQAAGASPIPEDAGVDAATDTAFAAEASAQADHSAPPDDAPAADEPLASEPLDRDADLSVDAAFVPDSALGAPLESQQSQWRTGLSCAAAPLSRSRSKGGDGVMIALAWAAAAVGRRRR